MAAMHAYVLVKASTAALETAQSHVLQHCTALAMMCWSSLARSDGPRREIDRATCLTAAEVLGADTYTRPPAACRRGMAARHLWRRHVHGVTFVCHVGCLPLYNDIRT